MINKRKLGKTKIHVSEIGLGGFQLGEPVIINNQSDTSFGGMNEDDSINLIKNAIKLGINTFDTADVYSLGSSEYRLGLALREIREDVNIFTKAGNLVTNPSAYDISYHHLIASIERSLKRLQTNYVDLFQIHIPPTTEKEFSDVERAFKKIKSEQKAKNLGISIGIKYEKGIEIIKRGMADAIQIYFSLIDSEPLKELLPLAKKEGVGVIIAEPLAQGLLTNKYKKGHIFPENDLRSNIYSRELLEKKLKRVEQFQFLIKENRTLNQAALAYILTRNEISTCIPGSKSIQHLKSNIESVNVKLENSELKMINEIQEKWND
tara:strand:- start:1228 stop:2190 length:963 start_codon:yes stop_codon:yes gene_type:complete